MFGAVLVAPAHSYPTGAVLGAPRRAALIEWAHDHDGLVIEDDYDAEFRLRPAPIGALQGLAPHRVAYAGCASKRLRPALRLGWIVLPGWLVEDVAERSCRRYGHHHVRAAGAGAIHRGRRIGSTSSPRAPIYRRRRDAAPRRALHVASRAVPTGVAAGLHLYVQLPNWCDESGLLVAARKRGLLIEGASWHWSDPPSAPRRWVLGYVRFPSLRSAMG